MNAKRPNPQEIQHIQTLRTELIADLLTFLEYDLRVGGYLAAWVGRNLELERLEELVDELDAMYQAKGRSILGRKPRKK